MAAAKDVRWLLASAALASGEACAFALAGISWAWPAAAAAAFLAAVFSISSPGRALPRLAALFAAGAALAMATARSRVRALDEILELGGSSPAAAVFEIPDSVRVSRESGGAAVSFAGKLRGIDVLVWMPSGDDARVPAPGEKWECAGWLERTKDGPLGRRRIFRVRGRGSYARCVAAADPDSWRGIVRRVRADLSRRAGIGLETMPQAADMCRAMLLGERHLIPRSSRDTFAAAGTVHVFAISGLHVLVIARLAVVALALAGVPFRLTPVFLLPLLWAYVALVGAGPSAVRAAAMASLYYGARFFWRRPDGLIAWSVTFMTACIVSPASLMDAGCILSFIVMLALVLWRRDDLLPGGGTAGRLSATLVAWAAGVPVVARVFGRFTVGGLLANLLAVPAAAVAVSAGALGIAASFASNVLAAHLNACAALTLELMAGISRLVAALPFSDFAVERWSFASCAAWYVALAAVWLAVRFAARRRTTWM